MALAHAAWSGLVALILLGVEHCSRRARSPRRLHRRGYPASGQFPISPTAYKNAWRLLILIAFVEAVLVLLLKQAHEFQHALPSIFAIGGYMATFYMPMRARAHIAASIACAVWAGIGSLIVLVADWSSPLG